MDYDVTPIQVFTRYSYEQMKAFQRFHFRKLMIPGIILFCFLIFSLTVNIISLSRYNGPSLSPISFLPLLFLIVFLSIPMLLSFGVFYTRKAHERATQLIQNGQYYSFCNNDFISRTEQQDNIGQSRTAYTVIYHVWETPDMFYIYINKNQAHLIDKQSFNTGSPDELRAILQSHMPPKKYKKYKI